MRKSEALSIRAALDCLVDKIAENAAEINNNTAAVRLWRPGAYVAGDVRKHEGIPYRCVQAHNSAENETWNPADTPALWMQYHGTSAETARPWIQPLGSEDRYRAGEWMIWTDGLIYRCKADTTYSPADYAAAWEVVT